MALRSFPLAGVDAGVKSVRVRPAVTLGAAFALLCVSVFGLEMPSSLAAGGLFDALFGGGSAHYAAPSVPIYAYGSGYRAYRHFGRHHRHASRHAARRHPARYARAHRRMTAARLAAAAGPRAGLASAYAPGAERRMVGGVETVSFAEISAATANAPTTRGQRAICVRSCDGYVFPVATLSRSVGAGAQEESCAKLCPGAQTTLFVMPDGAGKIDQAVAARSGDTYAQLVARIDPTEAKSKSCGCQSVAGDRAGMSTFLSDSTLRPGDTVVTPLGIRIVRHGSRYPFKSSDFLSLAETRNLPHASRGALAAIERAIRTPHGRLAAANSARRRDAHRSDWRL